MRRPVAPLLVLAASLGAAASGPRFRTPDASLPLSFPRDHGSHDDARVEWWYVTGHLETGSGRRLGYQLTFFRTGLLDEPRGARSSPLAPRDLHLAHFARTDVDAKTFRYAERIHRSGLGAAGAREDRLAVVNEEWSLEELAGRFVLRASDGDESLSLLLEPEKPPVLHGTNGLSRKGPEPEAVSRYVSFTRLKSSGWLSAGARSEAVTGSSWMDHEWGPGSIGAEAAGWDWFAIQLADGRDLMLYRIRAKDGSGSRFSSGTLVAKDGKARPLSAEEFSIESTATWRSPRSGGVYPARWRIRVPSGGLDLHVEPLLADQELVTGKSTRVTYWEGASAVSTPDGRAAGRAYVELTGYAGEGALGLLR